jgi:hypothetical protein
LYLDRRTLGLGMVVLLAACSDATVPSPAAGIRRFDGPDASLISHDFPTIQFPSGIANDGFNTFYISTLSGTRPTYLITSPSYTISGTQPGSANPRDVVWAWGRGLFYSDIGRYVELTQFTTPVQEPIFWRGGGIAHWRDSLYVGDVDTDSILVMPWPVFPGAPHPIIRKFPTPTRNEGLVADTTAAIPSIATLWSIGMTDGWMTEIDLQGNFIRRCNTPYTPGPFGLGGITLLRDTFFLAYPIGGDPFAGTRLTAIAKDELVCAVPDSIDIEPGRFPNRVNPRAGGFIEVAVLSTPDRDATTIIPASVRFGPSGAAPVRRSVVNLNGDTDLDVVFTFRIRDTGISCGDTSARLRASATSGPEFDASDSILTTGCGRP